MPKKRRLRRADFSLIAKATSKRYFGALFSLSVTPLSVSLDDDGPRCTCVVSKKIATHAVDRNTVKRRCREAVRLSIEGIPRSRALVLYAKKEAVRASYAEIEKDIRTLLSQIR